MQASQQGVPNGPHAYGQGQPWGCGVRGRVSTASLTKCGFECGVVHAGADLLLCVGGYVLVRRWLRRITGRLNLKRSFLLHTSGLRRRSSRCMVARPSLSVFAWARVRVFAAACVSLHGHACACLLPRAFAWARVRVFAATCLCMGTRARVCCHASSCVPCVCASACTFASPHLFVCNVFGHMHMFARSCVVKWSDEGRG